MENLVFTQLTIPEIRTMLRQELESYFSHHTTDRVQPDSDKLMTIGQAAEFLSLSVPTIYTQVSKSIIPCMKKGKRLYFSKDELTEWIRQGRKKSPEDIRAEADEWLMAKKKKGTAA